MSLLCLVTGPARCTVCYSPRQYFTAWASKPGVFNIYLLQGHILMPEIFGGRIHVLQSKDRILLQDMPTDIYVHKHTSDSFVILFTYLTFIIYSLIIIYPANIPYYSLAVFTTILTEISYIKNKEVFKMLVQNLKYFRMNFI
jgi:hypothetical protein